MAKSAEVTVRTVEGEPITGGWCARCLLPSVTTTPFTLRVGRASTLGRITVTVCDECGETTQTRGLADGED